MTPSAEAATPPDDRRRAILNPVSPGARRRPELAGWLERTAGLDVRITTAPGDAARMAQEALDDGVRTLVVAGGDGTLHEVVNGLGEDAGRLRLALLPLGTGNDMAASLGIPLDLEAALALLDRGVPRPLDLVRITGAGQGWLANFAMGGFAGRVAERVTPGRRRIWGRHVYLRAALAEVGDRRARTVRLRADGRELDTGPLFAVVVANGPRFGGGIPIAPGARPDDGFLDLLLLEAVSLPRFLLVIVRALRGRHLADPAVTHLRVRRVEVEAEPDLPWNGDGETLGTGSRSFEVVPGLLPVLLPPAG